MSPKHVLIGNGININFGGRDYTNGQIIERLSMKLKQNDGYYDDVFAGVVSSDELLGISAKNTKYISLPKMETGKMYVKLDGI